MADYFHGGFPGLRPGDFVEPAASLTLPELRQAVHDYPEYPGDSELVYLTTDRGHAEAFASMYRVDGSNEPGWVYRVEPVGPVTPDPDSALTQPPIHFTARRAEIVEVTARGVVISPWEATRRMAPYMTWDDDSPLVDERGYALPSPQMRALGITAAQLRTLGRWIPLETVIAAVQRLATGGRLPTRDEVDRALQEQWTRTKG